MSGVLNTVDQRTNLVGENRLELLLFTLNSRQLFAINVFKVKEVIKLPPLTKLPGSHYNIRGVASLRGEAVPVIDLRCSIGFPPLRGEAEEENLIVTEYTVRCRVSLLVRYVTSSIPHGLKFSRRHRLLDALTTSQLSPK